MLLRPERIAQIDLLRRGIGGRQCAGAGAHRRTDHDPDRAADDSNQSTGAGARRGAAGGTAWLAGSAGGQKTETRESGAGTNGKLACHADPFKVGYHLFPSVIRNPLSSKPNGIEVRRLSPGR